MTITEFFDKHADYSDDHEWALSHGVKTMAELWELPIPPDWRIWIATRPGVLTKQQRVLWACRCVRRIWHLLIDERSRTVVEVAERWARGEASVDELATARDAAAYASYTSSASFAARDAAASVAYSNAVRATAYAASAASAAYYSARSGDYADASYAAERDWQVGELVRMFGNPFKKGEKK